MQLRHRKTNVSPSCSLGTVAKYLVSTKLVEDLEDRGKMYCVVSPALPILNSVSSGILVISKRAKEVTRGRGQRWSRKENKSDSRHTDTLRLRNSYGRLALLDFA
jgi:hypothetical protein